MLFLTGKAQEAFLVFVKSYLNSREKKRQARGSGGKSVCRETLAALSSSPRIHMKMKGRTELSPGLPHVYWHVHGHTHILITKSERNNCK